MDLRAEVRAVDVVADATGQTPDVGTQVIAPWTYEYEYPIDCVKARFLPWNSNPQQPNPPLMTGLQQPPLNAVRLVPAPFLVTSDSTYPVTTGVPPAWSQYPEWWLTEGSGPVSRSVVLTNVPTQPQSNAATVFPSLVYTALVIYPSQWDDLFGEAMVAFLGQKLALTLCKDKKLGLALRGEMIKTAREAISEARAMSANESGYPQTTDHTPDWIRGRDQGGAGWWGGGNGGGWSGPGVLGYGWSDAYFADGSVY